MRLQISLAVFFVLLSNLAVAQFDSYSNDLIFYTQHYKLHLRAGIIVDKKKQYLRDSVIGNDRFDNKDSVVISYPFKERIDSAELITLPFKNKKAITTGFEIIFIGKSGTKTIVNEGKNLSKNAIEYFNNLAVGDKIIFRSIKATTMSDKLLISLAPLIIYITK